MFNLMIYFLHMGFTFKIPIKLWILFFLLIEL